MNESMASLNSREHQKKTYRSEMARKKNTTTRVHLYSTPSLLKGVARLAVAYAISAYEQQNNAVMDSARQRRYNSRHGGGRQSRQKLESGVVLLNIRLEALGLIFGFILGLGLLIGGIAITLNVKQASGLAVLGGAVGTLGVSSYLSDGVGVN